MVTDIPSGYGKYIEKLAREIFQKKAFELGYDPELIQIYGDRLAKGIKKGFGKDYFEVDLQGPDYGLLHSLEKNVWQFSAAKTYSQLKELSDALRKPDGTLRTFDEFKIQTSIITGKQLRHLKTEYRTAIKGANMADRWSGIQQRKHLFPLLEFVAIEDDRTSTLCRTLNGVVRPVDDPFWSKYYPPNHYNCRSTVKQVKEGKVTSDEDIIHPDIPEIFKVNLGQRGLAFPEDHAYFIDMPDDVMNQARQFFPYGMQFDILEADEIKGVLRQHYLTDVNKSDYGIVTTVARELASLDSVIIDIMPEIMDPIQRATVIPDGKGMTNPDLRVNKVLVDIKSVQSTRYNTLRSAIDKAYRQVNVVIIDLPGPLAESEMYRVANGRFLDHKDLKEIHFRIDGNYFLYKRGIKEPLKKSMGDNI
ncbi:minor capsid protein [Sphingobacterium hotanense]|uniref:minor capsid protein n=1 Tax=Sphingobacterium hotanense TaxID=649196 RepID=UPI002576F76B|nr:minor capsid protein [Sphingobacterium hotanense]